MARSLADGSGGLERGAVGVGWAVRASYVPQLLTAPPVTPGLLANLPGAGFAYALPEEGSMTSHRVRCGELTFILTRQRRLEQLITTSDDPRGFYQPSQATLDEATSYLNMLYDVWTEKSSGIGVAVPAGATLHSAGLDCVITLEPDVLEMRIGSAELPSPRPGDPASLATWTSKMETAAEAFESRAVREFLPSIRLDSRFSYTLPQTWASLLVNRKYFTGESLGGPLPPHVVQETLLATPRAFVGVAAVHRAAFLPALQPPSRYRMWLSAGFGTHLSTAPPRP